MSCDWNIRCLDCKDTHRFDDANHRDDLMSVLIKHAGAIADLAPLLREANAITDIAIRTSYGSVDVKWFVTHRGHRMMPVDEYGALLDQCPEYIRCECGSNQRCQLKISHDGGHSPKQP
jgi:hypothetical protein